MLAQWKTILFTTLIIVIYSMIFYLQINFQMRMDFYSFYESAIAYSNNLNPFQDLASTFYHIYNKLPDNLNPPAFITLISPIIYLDVITASSLWLIISLVFGVCGSLIGFYLIVSEQYFKKNWYVFMLIYLAIYPNLINNADGQVGNILLFFIMAGYYLFHKQKDCWAGVCWGFIITIKLFPGLLFLFVLSQKRYQVFFSMIVCCMLIGLLSIQTQGINIYLLYFETLSHITWYGSNWNGSLYGFIYRLLVNPTTLEHLVHARIIYYLLFTLLLGWYLNTLVILKKNESTHHAFCYTLVMMLLMSPLGWIYYFTLLIMPLTLIWQKINRTTDSKLPKVLWGLSICFLNFPAECIMELSMGPIIYKISFYSIRPFNREVQQRL